MKVCDRSPLIETAALYIFMQLAPVEHRTLRRWPCHIFKIQITTGAAWRRWWTTFTAWLINEAGLSKPWTRRIHHQRKSRTQTLRCNRNHWTLEALFLNPSPNPTKIPRFPFFVCMSGSTLPLWKATTTGTCAWEKFSCNFPHLGTPQALYGTSTRCVRDYISLNGVGSTLLGAGRNRFFLKGDVDIPTFWHAYQRELLIFSPFWPIAFFTFLLGPWREGILLFCRVGRYLFVGHMTAACMAQTEGMIYSARARKDVQFTA